MGEIISGFLRRFHLSTLASAGKGKKTGGKATKLSFEEWQTLNPGGNFKEYYVGSVLAALAGKKRHRTLGPVTHPGSVERAEVIVKELIDLGVSKSDIVVDYGCGTLRVGRKMIEYLEPAHYVGLDIDHRILDAGLAMLPSGLAEQKAPILEVIDDNVLDRVAAMRPRWIYCKGVLQHVPPADLQEFIGSICRLAHPDTNIVIWAMLSDSATQQASKLTWHHSVDGIISLVQSFGFDTEICECFEVLKMMRLRRSAHALNAP